MNIFETYNGLVHQAVCSLMKSGALPELDIAKVLVEPPRDAGHGDLATNAAMVLAKPAGRSPRDVAELLAGPLRTLPRVTEVSVAGPGFINMRLEEGVWKEELAIILKAGTDYGTGVRKADEPAINVEYVSANPTGPMHTGHARGAIFGDALANLLDKAGYRVTREYYLNDAGNQVGVLGRSAYLRYREALGEAIGDIPPGFYPGEYLKEVGQKLAALHGDKYLKASEEEWLPVVQDFAVSTIFGEIKADLEALGIRHTVFSSEAALVKSGAVQKALQRLDDLGLLYEGILEPPKGKLPDDWEPRPQLLFRSTQFGDDVDRPLKKSDGTFTYFASDIAYHYDKIERGSPILIDVLGADHGGYVKRMQAAVAALGGPGSHLDCRLCQMVSVLDNGVPVKMSKRAGTFITLSDMVERIGKDVLRFVMLTRRNDQTLELDYAKVTEQSKDNPVFYVQYAHARCCSVMRMAKGAFPDADLTDMALSRVKPDLPDDPEVSQLLRLLATWPRVVELAAQAHEPHRVAFYLQEVAAAFHALWTKGKEEATLRFIHEDDLSKTLSHLALVRGVAIVIASGLGVIGVAPVAELRS